MKPYEELRFLLQCDRPAEKFERFGRFYERLADYDWRSDETPVVFGAPSYAPFCTIVDHRRIRRPKNLARCDDQIRLLHAVAHIEYSAIDLALDAAYRFRNLPTAFYTDWLAVAKEEIEHFQMLETLLKDLGVSYGDEPVHTGLFDASMRTLTLLARMAVIPRHMEAGGLDANEQMRAKVQKVAHHSPVMAAFLEALDVILRDEIDHVRKGDRWFRYACEVAGRSPACFSEVVSSVLGHTPPPRQLNVDARLKAGFQCEELAEIAGKKVCD
jgi:uncharacterized ferritin-like protein (DUF455 family)